jgi:hypothetical protein
MEAARTSETLVNFYQTTRCYNPEDSNLDSIKSYLLGPLAELVSNVAQPAGTTDTVGFFLSFFHLITEAESSFRNIVIL